MYRTLTIKISLFVCGLFAAPIMAQLTTAGMQVWEKATPEDLRNRERCTDEVLLNFHCNIRGKLNPTMIRYHKDRAHTLSAVHTSGEDEWIWNNRTNQVRLSNTQYQKKRDYSLELNKMPSLYSYTAPYIKNDSVKDSITISFEDRNLYELIFTPKRVKTADLRKIHSYLSIKYGISLIKEKYYDSEGNMLWDPKKNKEFPHRLTGLGRDDGNALYQKQSSNQEDRILTIGRKSITRTNSENTGTFANLQFVLWSDNGKPTETEYEGKFAIMKRHWQINFHQNASKKGYELRIDKTLLNPKEEPLRYWLFLTTQDGEVHHIAGREDNLSILFSEVDFSLPEGSSTAQFTFATEPVLNRAAANNPASGETNLGVNAEQLLTLYPNPVKINEPFVLSFPETSGLQVSIFDGGGRMISQKEIDPAATKFYSQLTTQGSYLIIVSQHGQRIKTFKLIVH